MDIQTLRNDTPGIQHHIHLNSAGASLPPLPVIEAVKEYLKAEALHGGYEMAAAKAKEINGFNETAAQMVNAKAANIVFCGSATEAFNKALSSIPLNSGDIVLTTDDDYSSNQIAFIFLEKRFGVKTIRAAKLPVGGVDPQSVEELVKKHRPKLVSVTHVPTNSGLVQDVEAIGKICKAHDIWYIVDACQSAGQMPLDVVKIGCDFLSATMRKWLRGPRGAGFLYVSDKALAAGLEPFYPDLSGVDWTAEKEYTPSHTASRFGYFEKNYGLVLGSKAALEYALKIGLKNIEKHVNGLAAYTREQLNALPNWRTLDRGKNKCGIVTAHHALLKPKEISPKIKAANINLGFSRTENALIDFNEKGVEWAMRVSPHYYNTKGEVDELIAVLLNI